MTDPTTIQMSPQLQLIFKDQTAVPTLAPNVLRTLRMNDLIYVTFAFIDGFDVAEAQGKIKSPGGIPKVPTQQLVRIAITASVAQQLVAQLMPLLEQTNGHDEQSNSS